MEAEIGNSEILKGTMGDMLRRSLADGLHARRAPIRDPMIAITALINAGLALGAPTLQVKRTFWISVEKYPSGMNPRTAGEQNVN